LIEIDHVVLAVADLSQSVADVEQRFGVRSIEGGPHPDWGTANRIVPLGHTYLELVTVIDPAQADSAAFGRWIAGSLANAPRLVGWAMRVDDLDARAARLGLEVSHGSRIRPDGRTLNWQMAGVETASAEPCLPFLIQWNRGTEWPGQVTVSHPRGPTRLARLVLDGDPHQLAAWLGPNQMPVEIRPGAPAVAELVLEEARDRQPKVKQ